jgi:hypothetical protein
MAKLEIHPHDLAALIKSYPEIEANLLNKTTAAVAETLTRRVTNEQVQAHVDRCIAHLVQEKTGFNTAKLAAPFASLIHKEAKLAVSEAFDMSMRQIMRDQISQEVAVLMPSIMKKITAELKLNLKELMKDQLVEILLTK